MITTSFHLFREDTEVVDVLLHGVYVLQVPARDGRHDGPRPGGEHELLVAKCAAAACRDRVRLSIQGRSLVQDQFDLVAGDGCVGDQVLVRRA